MLRYERLDALPPNGLDFERAGGWTTQDVVCTKAGDTTLVLPVAPIRSDQVCCFRCVQARSST